MITFLIGLFIGSILGFTIAALCISAARADELMERATREAHHD